MFELEGQDARSGVWLSIWGRLKSHRRGGARGAGPSIDEDEGLADSALREDVAEAVRAT